MEGVVEENRRQEEEVLVGIEAEVKEEEELEKLLAGSHKVAAATGQPLPYSLDFLRR